MQMGRERFVAQLFKSLAVILSGPGDFVDFNLTSFSNTVSSRNCRSFKRATFEGTFMTGMLFGSFVNAAANVDAKISATKLSSSTTQPSVFLTWGVLTGAPKLERMYLKKFFGFLSSAIRFSYVSLGCLITEER